jgi:predicted nucleic acid-binding protein
VLSAPQGPRCVAAQAVADEVAEHLPFLAEKRRLNLALLISTLHVMPVSWEAPEVYEPFRAEAQRRMVSRDPDDWPTVALALALSLPVWSQDRDMEASGLTVYTTGDLLDALRDLGEV